MKEILKIDNLSLKGKRKMLVSNISLEISRGEIIGIVSDAKEGKSGLIKSICGLVNDYKGMILINGYDVKKQREKALKEVSLLSRTSLFYDYLSIEENIKIFNKFYRNISKDTTYEKLKLVGLYNRRKEKCKKLSQLSKNKLSLLYVLLTLPKLILVDDFFQDIDDETKDLVINYIKKEKNTSGVSFIISDDDTKIMEKLCDSIVFIRNGELIEQRTVGFITENSPSINDYGNEIMKKEF